MILVGGATGQLGTAVVHRLAGALECAQQLALARASPAASNLRGLSWINARYGTPYEMADARPVFGVDLTSLREFLERRVRPSERAR